MKNLVLMMLLAIMAFTGCKTVDPAFQPPAPSPTPLAPASEPKAPVAPQGNEAEMGKEAAAAGDYPKAIEFYTRWLKKSPQDAEVLFERGRMHIQVKQYENALKDFQAASASNPEDLRIQIQMARVLVLLKQHEKAMTTIQKIMAHAEFSNLDAYERFWTHYMAGQIFNTLENYEKALGSLAAALKAYAENPEAFQSRGTPYVHRFAIYHLSVANHRRGEHKKAAQHMEDYIDLAQKAGEKVPSADYKSLVLAYYLSDNVEKCKAHLSNLSPEDRKDLQERLGDNFFAQNQ